MNDEEMPKRRGTRVETNRRILTFLGVRMKSTDSISIHRLICRGLTYRACRRVMVTLDLPPQEMAAALGIGQRELLRLEKAGGRLGLVPSDRLYRITRMLVLAIEIFRRNQEAASWLQSPQIALNWMTPFELILSEPGSREVEDLLVRIAHGVIS